LQYRNPSKVRFTLFILIYLFICGCSPNGWIKNPNNSGDSWGQDKKGTTFKRTPSGKTSGRTSGRTSRSGGPSGGFQVDVPAHLYDIILGRASDIAITLRVLFYEDRNAYFEYGTKHGRYTEQTEVIKFENDKPGELVFDYLKPDTRYYYRMSYCESGATQFSQSDEYTFITQRLPGSPFTFTVQADPHLDGNTSTTLYEKTLENILKDNPDFHVDLGDTFMTGKWSRSMGNPLDQYIAQRYYFGLVCHSAPLYLVLGNHDGEKGGMVSNALRWRRANFPNPYPDGFYTGNEKKLAGQYVGNYYAWEWGDTLMVTLDPFWATSRSRSRGSRNDNWYWTLGVDQYRWLKETLEASNSKFKFIFIHHLVGGENIDGVARGGVEAAINYEWGGYDKNDKTFGFTRMRRGWDMPIHEMLVQNNVSIVFHGHDHLYVKQELDGIIYLECPQPGAPKGGNRRPNAYGYKDGVIVGSSGHIRVSVSSEEVIVDYVRAYDSSVSSSRSRSDRSSSSNRRVANRSISHTFTIKADPKDPP